MQSGDDLYTSAGFTGVEVVQEDQQTGLSVSSLSAIVIGMVVLVLLVLAAVILVGVVA